MGISLTVNDRSPQFLKELERKQVRFVTEGGAIIQSEQRSRAPKDSGDLINTIQSETFTVDGKAVSETGPTAYYAVYVEKGTGVFAVDGDGRKTPWSYQSSNGDWYTTSGAKAQPFAEPGAQAAQPKIDRLAGKILDD